MSSGRFRISSADTRTCRNSSPTRCCGGSRSQKRRWALMEEWQRWHGGTTRAPYPQGDKLGSHRCRSLEVQRKTETVPRGTSRLGIHTAGQLPRQRPPLTSIPVQKNVHGSIRLPNQAGKKPGTPECPANEKCPTPQASANKKFVQRGRAGPGQCAGSKSIQVWP